MPTNRTERQCWVVAMSEHPTDVLESEDVCMSGIDLASRLLFCPSSQQKTAWASTPPFRSNFLLRLLFYAESKSFLSKCSHISLGERPNACRESD